MKDHFHYEFYKRQAALILMHKKHLPLMEIERIVGQDHCLLEAEDLYSYGYDASRIRGNADCVVFPANTNEVAQIVKLANRELMPVYPRGAGTGMVGAAIPSTGGIVLCLNRFNRIMEIDDDNMFAVVQPGVINGEFQRRISTHGLFYPPDPASLQFSTLGGNVAMCAGGPQAVKYGVTKDYVLGLEAVLPTGAVVRTGGKTVKGVVGYDLTRLLVGSEGTLGIFTELTLRLIPAPESRRTMTAVFPELDQAARSVCEIFKQHIIPSVLELMDQATLAVVENYLKAGLPVDAEALLLIEVDGRECVLDQDLARVRDICKACGASALETAQNDADRERLWRARRSISPALGQIRPGKINEDVTVPRTCIPQLIKNVSELSKKYNLIIVCFGHAGDGNIHTNIMFDKTNADELRRAERAVEELFRTVLDLGGTISGEHGIGIAKSPFFRWEIGPEAFDVMWKIKRALDPNNILNPGKMFVPDRSFFQA